MFSILNMKHPLHILPVSRVKVRADPEAGVQYLHAQDLRQFQIPETRFATGTGEAHGLPAYQHKRFGRGAANPIRMDHPKVARREA